MRLALLLVNGVQLGNIWIGVQPPLGIAGDPMRLMFERDLHALKLWQDHHDLVKLDEAIAKKIIDKHLAEHHHYPETIAVECSKPTGAVFGIPIPTSSKNYAIFMQNLRNF